jgi:outer membrane receptor for ferrienterochelin and colicin
MLSIRSLVGAVAALALLAVSPVNAAAQGVTTGAVSGTVTDDAGQGVEGVQVQLRNSRTGLNIGTITRATGLYVIQGVEPDANYSITVRRIGFTPLTRNNIVVSLGQTRREDFKLTHEAAVLSTVTVTASNDVVMNATKTGTSTTISDSALRRLPTLNRNFADFVQLVPQVSTTTGFLSGGGVNLRQNAIQIDGAQSGDLFGLGTTGQPGAQANAKSIPLDAVKEYQVLLSPFDVRQGNFGGLLINAVTKSGTNEFHGSLYANTRNQNLTRTQPYLTDFSQQQYSASLGGPIMKDKLFFFATGEIQRLQTPANGAFIGAPQPVVSQASIDGLNNILATKYNYTEAGTGAQVQRENPNRNLFARVDAYLPYNTRLVLRHNYSGADNTTFSRSSANSNSPNFNLTSNQYQFSSKTNSSVAEFLTNLSNGLYNELLLNYSTTKDFRTVPTRFPMLTIQGIPRVNADGSPAAGTANFVLGTENSSQGNSLDQRTMEITDNLTIPVGAHSITLGTKNLFYRSINLFGQNSLGNWRFSDTTALKNGTANQYQVSAPTAGDPNNGLSTIHAAMYALYLQDAWQATPGLSITAGVRVDKPDFRDTPPENAAVFNEVKRHTSSVPTRAQVSPRVSFNWDVTGDQQNQLRGGIGQFSGPPPFVYLSNAFGNSGLSGFASLTCNNGTLTNASTVSTNTPAFNAASIASAPTACASGTRPDGTVVPGASVNLSSNIATIDPDFRFPKYTKATIGYDRRLPWNMVGTLEGLYTRSANNAFYQNLALSGPTTLLDRNGRVLYGTLNAAGASAALVTPGRQQIIDVTNSSGDYTWSTTAQLQKAFSSNFEGSVAYTYQQARDVVSVTSSTQGSNYRYQRDVSGLLSDKSLSRSKYDQPNRIVATGTYSFPSLTDVSFIYTGNSGAPYDYVYGSNGGSTGDLNADGQSQNDLIYVPKDARNASEILFTGFDNANGKTAADAAAQAAAFESFIASTPCLNKARGTILTRNACRNPWVNEVDVSIAQSLGAFGALTGNRMLSTQNLQLRLDVINFGNLLNRNWGQQAFSDQGSTCGQICSATVALTHVKNSIPAGGNSSNAQGVFTYDPNFRPFNADNASSNYRMQLSLRYSF